MLLFLGVSPAPATMQPTAGEHDLARGRYGTFKGPQWMLTMPRTYDPAVELALGKCLRLLTPVRPVDYAMVIGRRMVDKVVLPRSLRSL